MDVDTSRTELLMATFLANFTMPSESEMAVCRIVKMALLDYAACVMAGTREYVTDRIHTTVRSLGGHPQALVWGTCVMTTPALAAMANATSAHALDFDDTHPIMLAHPSIHILPGLLALAEQKRSSGREIILSYAAAFEVGVRLGRLLNPAHVHKGWVPIGTLGPILQAAACAKLLRLDRLHTAHALSLAANSASGLRANNGTMAKPILAGKACHDGLLAVLLAQNGVDANPSVFTAPKGFMQIFGETDISQDVWEETWAPCISPQVALHPPQLKIYPCCAGAHTAIEAALQLVSQHGTLKAEEIRRIHVRAPKGLRSVLIHPKPRDETQARFSLSYPVIIALMDGQVGPEQFRRERLQDPHVQNLLSRVELDFSFDIQSLEDSRKGLCPLSLTIELSDGTQKRAFRDAATGSMLKPLKFQDVATKFKMCVHAALDEEAAETAVHWITRLEQLEHVDRLVRLFRVDTAE